MFQLLPCSRCQRTFSVRSEVSEQALLKCPNCGNQFRLGELLDAFYAPWQVLENPGVPLIAAGATSLRELTTPEPLLVSASTSAESSTTGELAAHELAAGELVTGGSGLAASLTSEHLEPGFSLDGPDLELAEEAEPSGVGLSLDGVAKAKPTTDWSTYKPITHDDFQRLKRADRSPIWSTLQVVLGGAAAIPVSLLLMWYVLGKDVAGAGPAVAQYVPWIVPQKFRGYQSAEPRFESNSAPQRVPRRGDSGFRKFDDVLPPTESAEAPGTPPLDKAVASDRALGETVAESDEPAQIAAPEPATDQPATDQPATDQPATDLPPAPADTGADQPLGDVFALLKRTKGKVDDWQEVASAKDTVKREAALSLFEDLATLGVQFSSIPDSPGAPALARDKVQDIARAIKRQPDLTEVLHHAARAQLNGNLPRSKDGWVLVCTVGEMVEQAETWRVQVADSDLLPLNVPSIEIPKSLAPQLTGGQRLLLLGKFVAPAGDATQTAEATEVQSKLDDADPAENLEKPAPASDTFRASVSYGL